MSNLRLNQDCVRDIFLSLEKHLTYGKEIVSLQAIKELESLNKYSEDELAYTLLKINETKYLNMSITFSDGRIYYISISSISWEGHAFLDTIRDSKIWKKTKLVTSEFSSVSIGMLSNISTTILNNIIQNKFSF